MKHISLFYQFALYVSLIACLLTLSCQSTQQTSRRAFPSDEDAARTEIKPEQNNLTLLDYLRREPSLRISGSHPNPHIMVRGAQTISGENQPLFVVNGTQIGYSYQQVMTSVDIADIKSVRVLKDPASTSPYGMRGANGVIEIRTRKQKGQ
jgi:TonB-dependent SusC/RagA subfamily outer membrane receptor